MPSKFDSIRPYKDQDLSGVLTKLIKQPDLLDALIAYRFSSWPRASRNLLKPMLRTMMRMYLARKLKKISSVSDFQRLIEPFMERMIRKSTQEFVISGFENLDLSKPCLFISNHRDIALDPAFINWALHINGQDTVRIAVGDNLLDKDWIADLIRLNKCFIVRRKATERRQKLADAKLLSEYIGHSLLNEQQHIWIAQREGRAKDGKDITNPAIISMLSMNKAKDMSLADYVRQLRIVPVTISYEFDPCDITKAQELDATELMGSYDKEDHEDMNSIRAGITGNKGRVHVHFDAMLGGEYANAKEVAAALDESISRHYQLYPSAQVAAQMLGVSDTIPTQFATEELVRARSYLESRVVGLSKSAADKLLSSYARPYLKRVDEYTVEQSPSDGAH